MSHNIMTSLSNMLSLNKTAQWGINSKKSFWKRHSKPELNIQQISYAVRA